MQTGDFKFIPGRNCWTVIRANELGVLIDAESYYLAFLSALRQAKYSVLILAWDIHTKVVLDPKGPQGGQGTTLEAALIEALEQNSNLNVYILCWDFAMIYAFERQVLPKFRRAFRHPRIHFVLDSVHPFGASQHQKIVVIDDVLAFVGGLDFCLRRWDTRYHRPFDPRRIDDEFATYSPFHDIQVVVSGEAARSISSLAKDRWWRATGKELPEFATSRGIWPEGVSANFKNIEVGLARTYFSVGGVEKIREVEGLFLDSIASAKKYVYIENQYFTSEAVAELISTRLKEGGCPEFLILLPRYNSGWIEESTMAVLRNRLIRDLLAKDLHGRMRFYYPAVQSGIFKRHAIPISLHSKLMIIDDRILHIGSANLSNRSMGLDTECDIALVAESGAEVSQKISEIRNSLLAEHLGLEFSVVERTIAETDSLFAVVEEGNASRLNRKVVREPAMTSKVLMPFPAQTHRWPQLDRRLDKWMPGSRVLDPDRPVEEDPFFSYFIPKNKPHFRQTKSRRIKFRIALVVGLSCILMFPGAASQLGLLSAYAWLRSHFDFFSSSPFLNSLSVLFLGSLLAIPMDILIFGIGAVLLSFWSWFYIFCGVLSLATFLYWIGRTVRWWVQILGSLGSPNFLSTVDRPEQKNQFWGQLLLHWNLVAAFPIVCFQAGRVGTPFFVFFAGTAVGQIFRILLLSLYSFFFSSLIVDRNGFRFLGLLVTSVLLLILSNWSNNRFLPSYGDRKSD